MAALNVQNIPPAAGGQNVFEKMDQSQTGVSDKLAELMVGIDNSQMTALEYQSDSDNAKFADSVGQSADLYFLEEINNFLDDTFRQATDAKV